MQDAHERDNVLLGFPTLPCPAMLKRVRNRVEGIGWLGAGHHFFFPFPDMSRDFTFVVYIGRGCMPHGYSSAVTQARTSCLSYITFLFFCFLLAPSCPLSFPARFQFRANVPLVPSPKTSLGDGWRLMPQRRWWSIQRTRSGSLPISVEGTLANMPQLSHTGPRFSIYCSKQSLCIATVVIVF
jgi:hypothetical protein